MKDAFDSETVPAQLRETLQQSICLNSTGSVTAPKVNHCLLFLISVVKHAGLLWSKVGILPGRTRPDCSLLVAKGISGVIFKV